MKAIRVNEPGGPDQLTLGEHPKPTPEPEELLVRVHAAALNRADLLQREGTYPSPEGASDILGLDIAGTVEEMGERCINWSEGDRVMGLVPGGGYAEYAVIHQNMAMPVPPDLSLSEAAALPEVFLTAYQALHWIGDVATGEHVLIHAGASGVGTAVIQLAREAGAHPCVTASGPKLDRCRELGAEVAINYQEDDFAEVLRDLEGGAGMDLIIDFIGAPYFHRNIGVLATDGRMVLLAMLGGTTVEEVDLRKLLATRARIQASTLRARSLDYKIALTQDVEADVLPLFLDGTLCPVIDRTYDWTDVADAHRRMEANENVGKIVLRVVGGERT